MKDNISDEELLILINRLERLADLSDSKFKVPGTNIPIGLDAIIGLIPVVGEIIGLVMSFYIFGQAQKIRVPLLLKMRMLINIFIDFAIGFIPLVGDIADIGFRANIRNITLILEHIESERDKQKRISLESNHSFVLISLFILIIICFFLIVMAL